MKVADEFVLEGRLSCGNGEPYWTSDERSVKGPVPPHRSLIDLDTGTSAMGLFSLRATKICTMSVPDNGQSSIGGEVSVGVGAIEGRGLFCDVSARSESKPSRGEGVGVVSPTPGSIGPYS